MACDPCDIYFLAGEPSGDAYAAELIRVLQGSHPHLSLAGAGCAQMRATGIPTDMDMEPYAVMGFAAVIRRLGAFRRLADQLTGQIQQRQARVLVTLDYPGFNLRLIRRLKRQQAGRCRFCHVVAPQVWAWKPRRARSVARLVDRLCCFFPFEPAYFTRHGGSAVFVGHPLVDAITRHEGAASTSNNIEAISDLGPHEKILLLAPGSRSQEIRQLLPVFDMAARILQQISSEKIVSVIAGVSHADSGLYRPYHKHRLVFDRYRQLLKRAHCGLITSGTATLEAALSELPHIIAYRSDHLTATLGRHLIRSPYIGLPNIVHRKEVCPELLQEACTPAHLAHRLRALWSGPTRSNCIASLQQTRDRLGSGGASERIVEQILSLL